MRQETIKLSSSGQVSGMDFPDLNELERAANQAHRALEEVPVHPLDLLQLIGRLRGLQSKVDAHEKDATKPKCPAEEIIALYHEAMPENPKVKVISEKRREAIRARWRDAAKLTCKPFGYSNRQDGLRAWKAFFEVCADSDFLTGKTPSWNGRPPFIADIDFIMSPSGFAKILENKYHRELA